jgi:CRISPR system Cascade subunit CasA
MSPSLDLITQPWIPSIRADGQSVELGLRDTLVQAHELRELDGESPLIVAALHRLLLAVLHHIHGPANYVSWNTLWRAGSFIPKPLDEYFARWQERFNLFHPEHPFYQIADSRVKPKSVSSLVHHVASGNNATLFDHHTDAEGMSLTPAQAARVLLAAQSFGLAGLSGLPQKFTDGPCARGVIFLIEGGNLFQTLMLNLLRYDQDYPLPRRDDDRPAWEMEDPHQPKRNIPLGYLDYLTWQNRRILLLPEGDPPRVRQTTVAPGLSLDARVNDPMKSYRKDKKLGEIVIRFTEERALWRDSATFLSFHPGGHKAPLAYAWLSQLIQQELISGDTTRPTLALGMANYQAKVEFYRSERLSLPMAYLAQPQLVNLLRTGVLEVAEAAGRQLYGASATLARLMLSQSAGAEGALQPRNEDVRSAMSPWGVERRYWSSLELPFRRTLERLPEDREGAIGAWQDTLRRTAWRALDGAAEEVGANPRGLKASVKARSQLAGGLAKVLLATDRSGAPVAV